MFLWTVTKQQQIICSNNDIIHATIICQRKAFRNVIRTLALWLGSMMHVYFFHEFLRIPFHCIQFYLPLAHLRSCIATNTSSQSEELERTICRIHQSCFLTGHIDHCWKLKSLHCVQHTELHIFEALHKYQLMSVWHNKLPPHRCSASVMVPKSPFFSGERG